MGEELERLVGLERYGEMLGVLTPKQLVVVALRLEGMNGEEIAEELGISRKAVWVRLEGAEKRLLRRFPELEGQVEGRDRRVGVRRGRRVAAVSCGSV